MPNANKFALPIAAREFLRSGSNKGDWPTVGVPVQLVLARRLSYVRRTLRVGFQSPALRKFAAGGERLFIDDLMILSWRLRGWIILQTRVLRCADSLRETVGYVDSEDAALLIRMDYNRSETASTRCHVESLRFFIP